MNRADQIVAALAQGPLLTRDLARVVGVSETRDLGSYLSRLRTRGVIKRIDGHSGKGSMAVYATADYDGPVPDAAAGPRTPSETATLCGTIRSLLTQFGPQTIRQLVARSGYDTAAVRAAVQYMRGQGYLERVGTELVGTRWRMGIYALPAQARGIEAAGRAARRITVVDRTPCTRCGVRADVGCRHRPPAQAEEVEL